MRAPTLLIIGTAFALGVAIAAHGEDAPPSADEAWHAQLIIAPDAAQQRKTYEAIAGRPLSDNDFLVPWLRDNAAHLQPAFAFELSRRLFAEDHDAGLEWFVMAELRVSYDAARCTDPSIANALASAHWGRRLAPEVAAYVAEHDEDYLAALRRAEARSDLFAYDTSPAWICGGGLAADGKALQEEAPDGAITPPSAWPAIARKLREELPRTIAVMERRLAAAAAAASAAEERPHAVPETAVSGSLDDKIKAIGAEARASLDAPRDRASARSRPWRLIDLADAQIDAGDAAGARATIAEILTLTMRQRRSTAEDEERHMVALWIRAGDPAAARRLAESLNNPMARVAALGELGEGLGRSGDLGGARAALDLVERASESATAAVRRVAAGFDASPHDLAIRRIGDALADGGDAQGALRAATLLQGASRAGLLADIAGKQCTSGDNAAARTRELADAAAHALEPEARSQAAIELAYALATCNDVAAAVAAARDLAGDKSASALARVSDDLTGHGDYAHARQVDEANGEALVEVEDRIALAERQIARGDIELAKPNLAKARAMTLDAVSAKKEAASPVYELLEAERPLSEIIFAEIKAGAYADALASSQEFDRDHRPQYVVDIVAEMAKRRDARALARMLPAMLEAIGAGEGSSVAGDQLTRAAKLLGHAGYVAEGRRPLAMALALARGGADGAYTKQILRQVAQAQAALGDMEGARATVDALDLHGGQRAFFLAELALEKGDVALALQQAAGTEGIVRDEALSQIAWKQVEAGDVAGAMATAWQIHDLGQRSEALLALLKALGRA